MQNFFSRNKPAFAAGTALLHMSTYQRSVLWEYFSSVRKFNNKIYFRLIQYKVDDLTESKCSFPPPKILWFWVIQKLHLRQKINILFSTSLLRAMNDFNSFFFVSYTFPFRSFCSKKREKCALIWTSILWVFSKMKSSLADLISINILS